MSEDDCGEENTVVVRNKGENIRKEGRKSVESVLHSVGAGHYEKVWTLLCLSLIETNRQQSQERKKNFTQHWKSLWFDSETCPHPRVTF